MQYMIGLINLMIGSLAKKTTLLLFLKDSHLSAQSRLNSDCSLTWQSSPRSVDGRETHTQTQGGDSCWWVHFPALLRAAMKITFRRKLRNGPCRLAIRRLGNGPTLSEVGPLPSRRIICLFSLGWRRRNARYFRAVFPIMWNHSN